MATYVQIIYYVILILLVLANVITIIISKRKKKLGSTDGSDDLTKFKNTLDKILNLTLNAETLFGAITTGKVGEMKLQDVISKLQIDCLSNGEEFDEQSMKDIISDLISWSKKVN